MSTAPTRAPRGVIADSVSSSSGRHTTFVSLLLGLVGAAILLVVDGAFISITPLALVTFATVVLARKRLSPLLGSPAFYFAGVVAAIALFGFFLTNPLADAGYVPGLSMTLSDELRAQTANAMLAFATITLVAAAVARGRPPEERVQGRLDLGDLTQHAGWFVAVGAVILVALVYVIGLDNILSREGRFTERSSGIQNVVTMLGLGGALLVNVALFSKRQAIALIAFLELSGFFIIYFSMSSRRLALLPALVLLGYMLARRGKVPRVGTVVAVVATAYLTVLPLALRSGGKHGLFPYLEALPTVSFDIEVLRGALNNILGGFKITAITGFERPTIPPEFLWVSLDPGLGDSVGWNAISRELRISLYVPYSAVGELINYGATVLIGAALVLGIALGLLQRMGDRLLGGTLGKFLVLLSLGLIAMAAISATQYNLRAIARYIYLAIGIQVVAMMLLGAGKIPEVTTSEDRATRGTVLKGSPQ